MPHALVGLCGRRDGRHEDVPPMFIWKQFLTALTDYTWSRSDGWCLRCARRFYGEAKRNQAARASACALMTMAGVLPRALTTPEVRRCGGPLAESVGEYNIKEQVRGWPSNPTPATSPWDKVRAASCSGKGVSVACAIHTRLALDNAGCTDAQIVGSSAQPREVPDHGRSQGTAR